MGEFTIPLPPLEVQQEIVDELEGYQEDIEKKKQDIRELETAIQDRINKVWG